MLENSVSQALRCAFFGAVVLCFVIGASADVFVAAVGGFCRYDCKRIDDKNGITEPLGPRVRKCRSTSKDFRSRLIRKGQGFLGKPKSKLVLDAPSWTVYHYVLRSNTRGPGARNSTRAGTWYSALASDPDCFCTDV